jgi:hypothetical protein
MDWSFRTLLRAFLLVGGLVYVLTGVLQGSMFDTGLGAVAVVLGAVGLWWEWQARESGGV